MFPIERSFSTLIVGKTKIKGGGGNVPPDVPGTLLFNEKGGE